jgi:DNA-binding PadR family transcriptional regulator
VDAKTLRVLRVLRDKDPGENLSGWPIAERARVGSGTVYVILMRGERDGWITSRWEDGKPPGLRRRFYQLTGDGRRRLAEAEMERSRDGLRWLVPGRAR